MVTPRATGTMAIAVLLWSAPGLALGAVASEPATAPATEPAEQARVELSLAREAARAKDYEAALVHYERALALEPSAKLHFNIAVCHHRLLSAAAQGSAPYEQHRAAAVEAYNRYLAAAPQAEDRDAVAEMVKALGGTPLTEDPQPWTIELVEPDDVPDAPSFDDAWDAPPSDEREDPGNASSVGDGPTDDAPTPTPTPHVVAPRHEGPQGRFGFFVPLLLANPRALSSSAELRPLPTLGLGLRGNAFLGPRRRVALGGEVALTTQPTSARTHHRLATAYAGVLVEVRHPVGSKGRFEIGGGGAVGLGTQSLVTTGDAPLRCASSTREASRRNGLWLAPRFTFAALLGPRRNHELSARLGPGLASFGAGSRARTDADGMSCDGEPTAFETFSLPQGPALVVSFDLGYAPRF